MVETAGGDVPMLMVDTAEAAVLGSLEDEHVASHRRKVVANLGNEHTLAFHLDGNDILGLFEHHTHMVTKERLEEHLLELVRGDVDGDTIWREQGHGAVVVQGGEELGFLSVIGPMRGLLEGLAAEPILCDAPRLNDGCGLLRAGAGVGGAYALQPRRDTPRPPHP